MRRHPSRHWSGPKLSGVPDVPDDGLDSDAVIEEIDDEDDEDWDDDDDDLLDDEDDEEDFDDDEDG